MVVIPEPCTGLRRRISAAIYGWDRPLLTFIYPGFDCGSPGPSPAFQNALSQISSKYPSEKNFFVGRGWQDSCIKHGLVHSFHITGRSANQFGKKGKRVATRDSERKQLACNNFVDFRRSKSDSTKQPFRWDASVLVLLVLLPSPPPLTVARVLGWGTCEVYVGCLLGFPLKEVTPLDIPAARARIVCITSASTACIPSITNIICNGCLWLESCSKQT